MKLKLLAAAAALAVSSSAFAAIDVSSSIGTGTFSDPEIFAVLFDPTQRVTTVIDLGVRLDSFLSGATDPGTVRTYGIGSALSDFTNAVGVAGGNTSDATFAVFTGERSGSGPGSQRMLTTTNTFELFNSPFNTSNQAVGLGIGNMAVFVGAHNALPGQGAGVAANGFSTFTRGATTNQADYIDAPGNEAFLSLEPAFAPRALFGTAARLMLLTNNANGAGQQPTVFAFENSAGVATSAIDGNNLVYTAPIPEPGEWALMPPALRCSVPSRVAARAPDIPSPLSFRPQGT